MNNRHQTVTVNKHRFIIQRRKLYERHIHDCFGVHGFGVFGEKLKGFAVQLITRYNGCLDGALEFLLPAHSAQTLLTCGMALWVLGYLLFFIAPNQNPNQPLRLV